MILSVQIFSLIYSFFYGVVFYVLLEINYRFLYLGKIVYRIILSFLFVIFVSLLYFILLVRINNGILHYYFLLCFFTGYLFSFVIYRKINCQRK